MSEITLKELLDRKKVVPFYRRRASGDQSILPPISVELHWTSNCNYNCVHCSYGTRRQVVSYLRSDTIDRLLDNLIDIRCRAVYLSGGGEPTVLKGWDQHSDRLMDHGIDVALITNGIAIQEAQLTTIRRMNYVAVSVYSTIESRYEKTTESNCFADQFSLAEKIKSKSAKTIVGARCVLNNINFDEVYSIYKKTIESGFDYLIFIPALDYEGRGIVLESGPAKKVQKIIEANIDLFDHDKTNIQSLMSKGIKHYMGGDYRSFIHVPLAGCKAIQIRSGAFVNYDGGVYLCQPDIGNKELEIGNLRDMEFKELWNGDRHKEVLSYLNNRYNDGLCRNCRSIEFNQAMYEEDIGLIDGDLIFEPSMDPFL